MVPKHSKTWAANAVAGAMDGSTEPGMGLYNCDIALWRDSRRYYAHKGRVLVVRDGHIFVEGMGCLARFADQFAACDMLREAGYTQVSMDATSVTFKP